MWTSRLRLLLLTLLLGATIFQTSANAATDEVDAFFQGFKEKRDTVGAMRAQFVQRTFLPEEVVTTEGVLVYSKPRRILFKTTEPETAILVDRRRGYEYDAEIRQMTIFRIEDHPRADIFFLGFDDDTEALRRAYDVNLLITDDARGRHGINIKPRADSEDDVYFMEVNLFLRDADYLPYRIHIVNDAESQLFIDINDIITMDQPAPEDARIFVPEGVAVIEDDRIVDHVDEDGRYFPHDDERPHIEQSELPAVELPQPDAPTDATGAETSAP